MYHKYILKLFYTKKTHSKLLLLYITYYLIIYYFKKKCLPTKIIEERWKVSPLVIPHRAIEVLIHLSDKL